MSCVLKEAKSVNIEEAGRVRYDVVIVGAGTAGLSAALVLGRSRRRVLVLDGGEPRNTPSASAHGFFTRDGVSPRELLEIGREQLAPYEGVEYRTVRATEVSGSDGRFEVRLEDGTKCWRASSCSPRASWTNYPRSRGSGSSGAVASTTAPTATAGR